MEEEQEEEEQEDQGSDSSYDWDEEDQSLYGQFVLPPALLAQVIGS